MRIVRVRTADGGYIDLSDRYDKSTKLNVSPEVVILSPSGTFPALTDVLERFPGNLHGREAVVFHSSESNRSFRVPGKSGTPISEYRSNRLCRVSSDWEASEMLSWQPCLGDSLYISGNCWQESSDILRRAGVPKSSSGYPGLYSYLAAILSNPGRPVVLENFANTLPSSKWPEAIQALRLTYAPQFIVVTQNLECLGYIHPDDWKSVFVIEDDSRTVRPITSIPGTIGSLRAAVTSRDPNPEVQRVVQNLTIKIQRLYGFPS